MSIDMKYFVLKPKSKDKDDEYAKASRIAMVAYSDAIYKVDPELAATLKDWASYERDLYYWML